MAQGSLFHFRTTHFDTTQHFRVAQNVHTTQLLPYPCFVCAVCERHENLHTTGQCGLKGCGVVLENVAATTLPPNSAQHA
eukprot:358098-Chlamydomonas_euryale.AAC.3